MINTVLTRYDKKNIIGWAKGHSKAGFSINDWKSSKTLRKMKRISRWTLISGWGKLFQSEKNLCPGQCSHKGDCVPLNRINGSTEKFNRLVELSPCTSALSTQNPLDILRGGGRHTQATVGLANEHRRISGFSLFRLFSGYFRWLPSDWLQLAVGSLDGKFAAREIYWYGYNRCDFHDMVKS